MFADASDKWPHGAQQKESSGDVCSHGEGDTFTDKTTGASAVRSRGSRNSESTDAQTQAALKRESSAFSQLHSVGEHLQRPMVSWDANTG